MYLHSHQGFLNVVHNWILFYSGYIFKCILDIADMSDMKNLDARQQLLVITMEECGELIQACSKALRRGELYELSDSEFKLKQEVGDVYAMIDLLVEWDVLSWDEIEQRRNIKRKKLSKWSELCQDVK